MKVKIISPQAVLFDDHAHEVVLPGIEEEISIMNFHQSCICALRKGQIKVMFNDQLKEKQRFFIKTGIAQILGGELCVLVESYK